MAYILRIYKVIWKGGNMTNLNKVFLIGGLTRDPELRYTPNGFAVCSFNLAVAQNYKSKNGNGKESPCYINITAWGRQAETCAEYLKKRKVNFCGRKATTREMGIQRRSKKK